MNIKNITEEAVESFLKLENGGMGDASDPGCSSPRVRQAKR